MTTLGIIGSLAGAIGSSCSKYNRAFVPGMLSTLTDSKVLMITLINSTYFVTCYHGNVLTVLSCVETDFARLVSGNVFSFAVFFQILLSL